MVYVLNQNEQPHVDYCADNKLRICTLIMRNLENVIKYKRADKEFSEDVMTEMKILTFCLRHYMPADARKE